MSAAAASGVVLAGVVLAAGAGTRLRPLTDLRTKALCPVAGVPLVDLALDRLASHTGTGSEHLAVNAHHDGDRLAEHVAGRAHVSREAVALGTAGALGALRDWVDGRGVLLTNADAWLPHGVDTLVAGWDGERCRLLTVAADGTGDFRAPGGAPVRYVGACVLPWRVVSALAAEPTGLYEVAWREAAAAGCLDVHVTTAPAIDCGTPADYLAANLAATGGRSVVGAGATVHGTLERSVVWDGAWVGADEHLRDAVRAGDRHHPVTVTARPGPPPTRGP